MNTTLKYQPVIYSDGTVAILETILDEGGNVKAATYEPVRLEANSIGELETLLREVYKDLRKTKPITEDELDAALYGNIDMPHNDEDDNVIDLVAYFADPKFSR